MVDRCPRCHHRVMEVDYDPVHGSERGCWQCGWREQPATLPLVFDRQLKRQDSAETRRCEGCGAIKPVNRFRSKGARRCSSCESAVWNAVRRERARQRKAAATGTEG